MGSVGPKNGWMWFTAVKNTTASGLLLILSVLGQKVKGLLAEILTGSREEEATGAADRATIATTIVPTASPDANPRIVPYIFYGGNCHFA